VAHELARLIYGLHEADGRVAIPGFYADVTVPDAVERDFMASIPYGGAEILSNSTARALVGEAAFTPFERTTARPSLDVNGMWSGFTGEGHKSIIPATAMAKISIRLVPEQDPRRVAAQLRAHLDASVPSYLTWDLAEHPASHSATMAREGAYMRAAQAALEQTFGTRPVFMREGGSIHVIGMLQGMLGLDTILMGFALPDDSIHSPNERQHVPTFLKGIEAYTRFLHAASAGREG
jgi:acetylornithine deacetylase/succinyl-diaminopimelate desuccinylase-like protein